MKIWVRFWNSAWRRSDSSCSVRMSMSQPVSCEASRTFWPRRPIASESCCVRHHDLDALAVLVEHDLGDFGRRQRVDHEGRDVLRPRNDVDLLALQFVHHRLHARAAHADAGADRIDRGIARDHRDLGARAGIAGDRLHLDDAVIDFRHFLREQLGHELRMRAGEENLRAARLAAHVVDEGADAVAVAERLARQHLVAAHDRLAAAEIDDHVAVFDALDDAVDDVADAVLVFLVLPVALGLAHLLHDHLLGGLRGDAAVFQRRQRRRRWCRRPAPPDCACAASSRLIWVDGFSTVVDHQHVARQPQLAGLGIDLGVDVGLGAVARARRLRRSRPPWRRSRCRGRSTSRGRPRRRSATVQAGWR